MTDSIKRQIEHLLDEPDELPASEKVSDSLRSRLTATLSEGLENPASSTGAVAPDIASMAAFLDGRLSGAEREKFVAEMARQPSLRADLESTAALVDATSDATLKVPAHLLARANAQFAPAPPPRQEASQWDLSALLAAFLPRQRVAWALVAAVALIVAVPAGLMIRDQSGGGAQPELSGVSEPVNDTSQQQKDKACEEKKAKDEAKAKAGKSDSAPNSTANAPEDPCDQSNAKQNGAKNK